MAAAGLQFGNSLPHRLCDHLADALADGQIIEGWIEFVGRERLLRLQGQLFSRGIEDRLADYWLGHLGIHHTPSPNDPTVCLVPDRWPR